MENQVLVESLMTKNVISVTKDVLMTEAVDILVTNNFNGLPVVDDENTLIGILTQYDLVVKDPPLHLPTFLNMLKQIKIYNKDADQVRGDIKKILAMRVEDVMNRQPVILHPSDSVDQALRVFGENHSANPIPVVDENHKLTGILSRFDLIKTFGVSSARLSVEATEREVDRNINKFLNNFDRNFVLVNRWRTYHWLLFSLIFFLLGFVIAFAIILRIE